MIALLDDQTVTCIALAPLDGLLFWNDLRKETINRISMNGDKLTFKSIASNVSVAAFSIDHNLKKLYWTDLANKEIRSIDFDGQFKRKIFSVYSPAIAFHNGFIYYLDLIERKVFSINVIQRTKTNKLIEFQEQKETHLKYFSQLNQPERTTQCSINNGGCSYACVLTNESPYYACACPTGIQLNSDSKTCKSFPDEFLFLASENQINYISLDTNAFMHQSTKISNQQTIYSIDFDHVEQRIYWVDKNKVKSAFLNGSDEKLITSTELEYERLKIDTRNRNIYLVKNIVNFKFNKDREQQRYSSNFSIELVSLDGRFKKTLIDDFILRPRSIAIDLVNEFFYWSDFADNQAKIEKVSFDLQVRKTIITKDMKWPNGIVIDNQLKRLYWCDSRLNKIEYADLDGSNRQVLVKLDVQLLDITLINDFIYWIDILHDEIGRVHKLTGKYEIVSNPKLGKIRGINAVSNRLKRVSEANERRNCTQLNLSDNQCACSDGYLLQSDNSTCLLGDNTCNSRNGGCEQKCNQIIGNYHKCSCNENFILNSFDRKSCSIFKLTPTLPVIRACKVSVCSIF